MRPADDAAGRRPLTPGMRRLLWVATVLVAFAGVQLFVFPEQTERFFAWTINPPITAAFLGASYWASVVFEGVAARQRAWADARITVPTVFAFTVLTLVVTVVHLDRFHLGPDFAPATQAVTWLWIGIYAVVPVIMAILWVRQERMPGSDPSATLPLPRWVRGVVATQAVVLLAVGVMLLVAPATAAAIWPWELTPLTGRAIGAWLASLGIAAVHSLIENCARRLRPAAYAYLAFSVLQLSVLARYPDQMEWMTLGGLGFSLLLLSTLVVGVAALRLGGTER